MIVDHCRMASDAMNQIMIINENSSSDHESKKYIRRIVGEAVANIYAHIEMPIYDKWPDLENESGEPVAPDR